MANKRLAAIITIGGAVSSTLGRAFGAVTRETDALGSAINRLKDRQRELNAELAKIGRDGNNQAGLRAQYANQELEAIKRQVAVLKQRKAIEDALTANRARRAQLGAEIGSTMATGAAMAAPIGLAIREAADFDYELQLIGNTARMTKAEVEALGRGIIEDSKRTGQSTNNLRRGLGFLIAAGMDVGLARQMLASIGKTATATRADVEDLAKTVFTLSDSLKIAPKDMESALDVLAEAGKEGSFELQHMAKQLPVLGAGFVSLKMDGKEAAATMAAALQIARKGASDADEAANNMKNFIAKILSPETLKKAQKNFGIDLYKIIQDAQKSGGNPFEASMEAIIKATKGDQKALGELFQDMQVQNFLRPMIQQWDDYRRIKQKALGAEGTVERDFATMMETTKQKMMEVTNALGRLGIALGSVFMGATGDKSNSLAVTIGKLTDFIEANRELVSVTAKVVGGLFALRLATLGVQYAWTVATGAYLATRAAWLAAPAVFTALGTALRFVGAAALFVGRALLLNPIGLAVTAIAVSVGLIYTYWGPLKEWFAQLWADIKASFAAVHDWIVGKVAYLMELPGRIKDKLSSVFGNPGNMTDLGGGYDANGIPTGPLPELPAPATRGGTVVNDSSQTTFNITQQPGQDSKALADEIDRMLSRRQGVRARSSLVDGVGAQ